MGTWETDLDGKSRVRWSTTTELLFGFAPGSFNGRADEIDAKVFPEDLKTMHEIRAPLGAILGFTELLRDPTISQSEREEYLKIVSRNGETLTPGA